MLGRRPEAELEDEETEHRDRTITISCVLGEEEAYINVLRFLTFRTEDVTNAGQLEAKRRAKDDAQKREPAHGESGVSWQLVERRLDAWYPDGLHRARHNSVWDEPERDDTGRKGRSERNIQSPSRQCWKTMLSTCCRTLNSTRAPWRSIERIPACSRQFLGSSVRSGPSGEPASHLMDVRLPPLL